MKRHTASPSKQSLLIRTHALTHEEDTVLQQLSQDATDFLGRSISSSAIVRALIRQVARQKLPTREVLFLEVEQELNAGVMWGKKK